METLHCCFFVILLLFSIQGETKADWGRWSPCTRTCGAGVARRVERCPRGGEQCRDQSVEYKLCNIEDCSSEHVDFRSEQCAVYNSVPFRGELHSWIPHTETLDPCALICRTNGSEQLFIVKFLEMVTDGTKCDTSTNSVCIEGKCMTVGCDNVPGSVKKLDDCGVCGGDGSSCLLNPHMSRDLNYQWEVTWGTCSVTCGTGYQRTSASCKHVISGLVVDSHHCLNEDRPKVLTLRCTMDECLDAEKDSEEWNISNWSSCSSACGIGHMYREVRCRLTNVERCAKLKKPATQKRCDTGTQCPGDKGNTDFDYQGDDWSRGKLGLQSLNPTKGLSSEGVPLTPRFTADDWSSCSVTCGVGFRTRTVACKVYFDVSGLIETLPDSECYGERPAEKEECKMASCVDLLPSAVDEIFGPDETFKWTLGKYSICSHSCLGGQQRTRLECVREKDGSIVSTSHCLTLIKPATKTRACNVFACPPRWRSQEYGPCTADCGGGVQRRVVECVQDVASGKTELISDYRCPDPIPISERSCNVQFCPARWMTANWTDCSVTCGPGVQTRRAYCVKSPIRGKQVTVADTECMGPKPMTSRECQLSDCFAGPSAPPFIKAENYTFIQFRRSKRVKLNVGGRLVILPGQSVTIRCPVKNYHRRLLFWSKGYKLISMAGRVRITFSGNLKIRKANPQTDAGKYTCMAGFQSADVTIAFQTRSDARKKAREMQKYVKDASRNANLVIRPTFDKTGSKSTNDGVVSDTRYNTTKKLVFTAGDWTSCSVTCGSGHQKREVTCARVTEKYAKILPYRECIKWGLKKPDDMRKCSLQSDCPAWKIGKWSKCSNENCVRDGYAQKKRPLHCKYTNGTITKLDVCNAQERPEHKQECVNLDCMAVWKTFKWSECLPMCGKEGSKSRILTCVWRKTKLPAWSVCKWKPRPTVKKPCKPKSCLEKSCMDNSRYCSLVGMLKMCRYEDFRMRCCDTCQRYVQMMSTL